MRSRCPAFENTPLTAELWPWTRPVRGDSSAAGSTLALRLKQSIDERSRTALNVVRREYLETAAHAFELRVPDQLRMYGEGTNPLRRM